MGNKRKKDQTADEIRSKIQKLQEKLTKKTRPRPRVIQSSSEDESNDNEIRVHVESHPTPRNLRSPVVPRHSLPREPSPRHARSSYHRSPSPRPRASLPREPSPRRSMSSHHRSPRRQSRRDASEIQMISPPRAENSPRASPEPEMTAQDVPVPTNNDDSVSPAEIALDDEILEILGDAPKQDTVLGKAIHKDVASRWQDILSKGLKKDVKEKIVQEYLVPSNCELLLAPTLNPEAKAAIPEALVKRDSALMHKQHQLGIALAALANVTEMIISNESSKQKILKPLSDACRILCDSHYTETKSRRFFVISAINTNLKDTLINTTRDKLLFGENVTEKLKAAQSIQKSGNALKNVNKTSTFTKSNFAYRTPTNKNNLNFKPQHRKADNKPTSSNMRSRPQPARAPPRPSASARYRKTSDRSPVRRNQRRY